MFKAMGWARTLMRPFVAMKDKQKILRTQIQAMTKAMTGRDPETGHAQGHESMILHEDLGAEDFKYELWSYP